MSYLICEAEAVIEKGEGSPIYTTGSSKDTLFLAEFIPPASTKIGEEPKRAWGTESSSLEAFRRNVSAAILACASDAFTEPDASAAPVFSVAGRHEVAVAALQIVELVGRDFGSRNHAR